MLTKAVESSTFDTMRDLDVVFTRLAGSAFRRRFRLGPKESAYLRERGRDVLTEHARDLVRKRLSAAEPVNDGKQTPMRGHPVFIAQHATATCCRSCLAKWHGIAAKRPLSPAEQEHVVEAIVRWLEVQPSAEASPAAQGSLDLSNGS